MPKSTTCDRLPETHTLLVCRHIMKCEHSTALLSGPQAPDVYATTELPEIVSIWSV